MREALECFRAAIALDRQFADARSNMACALTALGRYEEAAASCREALRLRPDNGEAWYLLGVALQRKGERDEALAAYQKALALAPGHAAAQNNLGAVLKEMGRSQEAVEAFEAAVKLVPGDVDARLNLADALFEKGRLQEAIGHYERVIQLDPARAQAYTGLGNALKSGGRPDEAIAAYRKGLERKADNPVAWANLGAALRDRGAIDEAIGAMRKAVEIDPDQAAARSMLILTMYLKEGVDRKTIAVEKREWDARHGRAAEGGAGAEPFGNERSAERRLRVGYVSGDFRDHPVGRFMLPLLERRDRREGGVEVVCYSGAGEGDAITRRARECADVWREIGAVDDEGVARMVRQDGIDVLVDLGMHTIGNRLGVFARRPAPVQVSYLAYCDGAGLSAIRYRLTDGYLEPADAQDDGATEEAVRLAETYWCYAPGTLTPEPGPLPALATGRVTFGCLNDFCKVTRRAMEAWWQALRETPGSRMVMFVPAGSCRERVRAAHEAAGIDAERVEMVGRVPIEEYFKRYQGIDLALDTFGNSGGTTTCDALWMGVPVVSLAGRMPTTRGGLSILSNVGLGELVAETREDYARIAVGLAGDLRRLGELRARLRKRMQNSPLMDATRFARSVEAAYREMWRRWCAEVASA